MKTDRQKLILELISRQNVGTQQQLLELLASRGCGVPRPPCPGTFTRSTW